MKDTKAPEFEGLKETYQVAYNTKLKTDVFKVKDLSDATVTLDDSQVNYKKAGEYKAIVIAKDTSNNETKKEITIKVTEQEKTTSQNKQETTVSNKNNTIATQKPAIVEPKEEIVDLAVPHHAQYAAGAPMGCEAASLLQALQYKGYAKGYDLTTFLKEMPYAEDNNPFHGYAGSPYKGYTDGIYQSIFPEPLANWGKRYGNVSDLSGKSATDVINQVKHGNPVVVFVVYKYGNPKWLDWTFTTGTYRLVDNSHVMTVSGYNPETKQVKVTDPAAVKVGEKDSYWVSWSDFKRCYEYMKFAVVVK